MCGRPLAFRQVPKNPGPKRGAARLIDLTDRKVRELPHIERQSRMSEAW